MTRKQNSKKKNILEIWRSAAECTLRKSPATPGRRAQARRHPRRSHRTVQWQQRRHTSQLRRRPIHINIIANRKIEKKSKTVRESRVYLEREKRRRGEATGVVNRGGLLDGAVADLLKEEEAGFEMADFRAETEDRWKILLHLDAIFFAHRNVIDFEDKDIRV